MFLSRYKNLMICTAGKKTTSPDEMLYYESKFLDDTDEKKIKQIIYDVLKKKRVLIVCSLSSLYTYRLYLSPHRDSLFIFFFLRQGPHDYIFYQTNTIPTLNIVSKFFFFHIIIIKFICVYIIHTPKHYY